MRTVNIIICSIAIVLMINLSADSEEAKSHYLKPWQTDLTVEDVLKNLSNSSWEDNNKYLRENLTQIERNKELSNNPEVKKKLIELLTQAHKVSEDNMRKRDESGRNRQDFTHEFYINNIQKGFIGYVSRLNLTVIRYKEPETIPLILKTEAFYPSDETTGINFYLLFGKPALHKIMWVIENDRNDLVKNAGYFELSNWFKKYIDDQSGEKPGLDQNELEKAKELVVLGSRSKRNIFSANFCFPKLIKIEQNENEKTRLKNILKESLSSNTTYDVREFAAQFLGEVGDRSDVPDLEKLLSDEYIDKFALKRRESEMKMWRKSMIESQYPVRDAARKAIAAINQRNEK